MFDQQIDIDGGAHDLAPETETMRLFDSAPQIRGQIALETDNAPDVVERRRQMFESLGWGVTR